MDCKNTRTYLDAFVDGELDLVRAVELETHLETCGACASAYEERQAIKAASGSAALYAAAPFGLRERVQAAVRAEVRSNPASARRDVVSSPTPGFAWPGRRWLALAASLAVVAGAWAVLTYADRMRPDPLAREVVASHVRSLLRTDRVDVAGPDTHKVKPWFNGKIDFSPPVKHLDDRGFMLIGGRVDYLDERTVAALVYQRQQHVIDVFIWPAPGDDTMTKVTSHNGYHALHWRQGGMTCWVVSDLNEAELRGLAMLLREPDAPATRP